MSNFIRIYSKENENHNEIIVGIHAKPVEHYTNMAIINADQITSIDISSADFEYPDITIHTSRYSYSFSDVSHKIIDVLLACLEN